MYTQSRDGIQVRSAFLSDIHLGARECRAELVLDFLHAVRAETLFLVGDIVDAWSLRRSFYWPQSHNNVLRTLLGMAKHGTRIVYIPGNHDEMLRELCGHRFGNLEVHREYVHTTARGLRMLVMHGDEFDSAVKCRRWLTALGSRMYDVTLGLNRYVDATRRLMGYPYWSLASYLKTRVGNALEYVRSFEEAAAHAARSRGYDGVICGHIHRPEVADRHGVLYCNDGDWVDSCTALIEDRSGELELWNWAERLASMSPARRALPKAA